MNLTKTQLKQIIKEELNEALAGGIDEYATFMGIELLPSTFTDEQLIVFVDELLATTPAMVPGGDLSKIAPRKQGETDKHWQQRLQYARKDHPLTTTGVGFELEKLIINRRRKAKEAGRDQDAEGLEGARVQLLNVVSPTGDVAARKGFGRPVGAPQMSRSSARTGPGKIFRPGSKPLSSLNLEASKMKLTKSQLKQIILQEVSEAQGTSPEPMLDLLLQLSRSVSNREGDRAKLNKAIIDLFKAAKEGLENTVKIYEEADEEPPSSTGKAGYEKLIKEWDRALQMLVGWLRI